MEDIKSEEEGLAWCREWIWSYKHDNLTNEDLINVASKMEVLVGKFASLKDEPIVRLILEDADRINTRG